MRAGSQGLIPEPVNFYGYKESDAQTAMYLVCPGVHPFGAALRRL
jgi:hypothetical protein